MQDRAKNLLKNGKPWNYGKKLPYKKRKPHSEETKRKQSLAQLGKEPINKGIKVPIEKRAFDKDLFALDPQPNPHGRGLWISQRVNEKKQKARKKGKVWKLTNLEAAQLIIGSCTYCGFKGEINEMGIDRIDNSEGYISGNVCSCCFTCNSAKGTKSISEFIDWANRLISHQSSV